METKSGVSNGIMYGIATMQGCRPYMEDTHHVESTEEYTFFGLYDGHGGREVADFAANKLHTYCNLDEQESDEDVMNALYGGFLKTHESLDDPSEHEERSFQVGNRIYFMEYCINANMQGCTALVALIRNGILFVANAGDSRAILCKKNGMAIPRSYDHKLSRDGERNRITEHRGEIKYINGLPYVNSPNGGRSLGVSRALGDKNYTACGVIPEPEIMKCSLRPDCEFLIMATDGVWDVLNNEKAAAFAKEELKKELLKPDDFGAAAELVRNAAYIKGSKDNISVIVVGLMQPQ